MFPTQSMWKTNRFHVGKGRFAFREERKCLVSSNYTKTLFKQANKAKCQSLSEFKIALAYNKICQK